MDVGYNNYVTAPGLLSSSWLHIGGWVRTLRDSGFPCLFYGEKDGEPSSGPPPLLHTPARPESPRSMPPRYSIWPSPGATKSRLSATATPPRTHCKLRVAHNKDLQARQLRVVYNPQLQIQGIVPGGSGRGSPAAAPATKTNPAPPFLRRKDPAALPLCPTSSQQHAPPAEQVEQLSAPKGNRAKNRKKQDPIQP